MSEENPMVSVVMPVYNVRPFLEEAIQSVLKQSLHDIELILVNDGSTDGSDEICRTYTQIDKRISYIEQENKGVSVARNVGLAHSKGKYLFFMDSDDTIDKDFLSSSYDIAQETNSDIVVLGEYYCKRMPHAPAFPTCAMFIRLEFLRQFPDIKFPEGVQPCEDGLFSHQLLALTDKIAENPHALYFYRQHAHQNHVIINTDNWRVLHQIPIWFEILEQFYKKHNLFNSHTTHLVRFIEHEPFEFRYLGMPLDDQQKKFLFQLIHVFFNKNVRLHLKTLDTKVLNDNFWEFLTSQEHSSFDKYYHRYLVRRKNKKKLYRFLIKFVPLKRLRRKWSTAIDEQFG